MANKNIDGDVNVQFTEASSRQSLESGESVKTLFGKLRKWLSDLKPVAFSGSYNDLSGKPTIPDVSSKVSKSGDTMTGDLQFNTIKIVNDSNMIGLKEVAGNKPTSVYADIGYFSIILEPYVDPDNLGWGEILHYSTRTSIGFDYNSRSATAQKGLYLRGVGENGSSHIDISDAVNIETDNLYLNSKEVFATTVRYDTPSQGLTDTQKSNARTNIGAAAGNHGHTDLGLRGHCVIITDWNSATTNGWYMASSASNAPNGDTSVWYFGRAIAHNANYVFQEVWQFTHTSDVRKSIRYTRICLNGTWGSWTRDNIGLYDGGKWAEGDKLACVIKNNKENSNQYNPIIDVATVNGHWSMGTLGSTGNNHLYFILTTDSASSSNMFIRYVLEGTASITSTQTYNILTTKNYTSYCATPSQLSGKQDTITKTTANPTYVSNNLFDSEQIARLSYVKYNDLFAYLKVNLSLSSASTTDFVTVATLPFTVANDTMVCAPLQDTTATATLLITGGTNAIKLYKKNTTSGWFRQAIFIPIK